MLGVAAAVTLILMFRASSWSWRFSWFYVWALVPYAELGAYVFLRRRRDDSGAATRAGMWASLIVLVFSCWAYASASFGHLSSTSALAFIFVPFYLVLGGHVLVEVLFRFFSRKGLHG